MAKLKPDYIEWVLTLNASDAQKEIHNLSEKNKELRDSNKDLKKKMTELIATGKAGGKQWKNLTDRLNANNKAISENNKKIAECEKKGKSLGVVTQNIDGLHQAAGSKRVYEIHGSVERNYCEKCHKFFDAEYIKDAEGVPYCDACGGIVKPDVVLYEEGLSEAVLNGAIAAIQSSDVLVVLGTSLVVYPAAGLLRYFGGKYLVLVNRDATPYDTAADLVINDTFENVFPKLHI